MEAGGSKEDAANSADHFELFLRSEHNTLSEVFIASYRLSPIKYDRVQLHLQHGSTSNM